MAAEAWAVELASIRADEVEEQRQEFLELLLSKVNPSRPIPAWDKMIADAQKGHSISEVLQRMVMRDRITELAKEPTTENVAEIVRSSQQVNDEQPSITHQTLGGLIDEFIKAQRRRVDYGKQFPIKQLFFCKSPLDGRVIESPYSGTFVRSPILR